MLRPVLVAAPTVEPISLAEAKAQVRAEDFADDDGLLTQLIVDARSHLDGWSGIIGRCLINQSWRVDLAEWPGSEGVRLPFPDVSAITSVKYSDADNAEQTVSSSLYELIEDERGGIVRFRAAFTAPALYDDRSDRLRVTLVAGFGAAAANVPADLRMGMLLHIGHLYANREAVITGTISTAVQFSYDSLVKKYGRIGF